MPRLGPGETVEIPLEECPQKGPPQPLRSHEYPGPIRWACSGPESGCRPPNRFILPKRYPLPPLALPGSGAHQPGGVSLAQSVSNSEASFISVREYRPGHPRRRIHWRAWARAGKPIVKEYQDEYFVRHALILDTFAEHSGMAGHAGRVFEEAVSVAASFAGSITTQESLLDLMFVGSEAYCFTSGRGIGHSERMLEILASVGPCRDKPFSVLLPLVLEHAPLPSGCICVLLAWDEERKDFIRGIEALGIPLLGLVITASERKNPRAGI